MKAHLLITALTSLLSFSQAATPSTAVTCEKCHTVYFKAPGPLTPANKGFVALHTASRMECKDCETRIIAWVKTGTLTTQVCKSCGGTLQCCTQH